MIMKRFIIATIFSLGMAAEAAACLPEAPTHNSYVFSVFRREAVGSPFRDDMNDWWKRYGGEPESTDEYYYMGNRERLRKIAQKRADGGMTSYMRMLDAYLEISDGVGMDSWDYPTKQELARRDSTLRRILAECGGQQGGKHAGQFALMTIWGATRQTCYTGRQRRRNCPKGCGATCAATSTHARCSTTG